MSELNKIALQIISNGKVSAADESTATMTKRLIDKSQSNKTNRLLFRQTLFRPIHERMHWWSNII